MLNSIQLNIIGKKTTWSSGISQKIEIRLVGEEKEIKREAVVAEIKVAARTSKGLIR